MGISLSIIVVTYLIYRSLCPHVWDLHYEGIFFFHIIVTVLGLMYLSSGVESDAENYLIEGLQTNSYSYDDFTLPIGTAFIPTLVRIFAKFGITETLDFTLIFQLFGAIGISLLYRSYSGIVGSSSVFLKFSATALMYVPGLHFWSFQVGKDGIACLSTGLLVFGLRKPNKQILYLAFSVTAMMLVRPHVAIMMMAAIAIASLFSDRKKEVIMTSIFVIALISLVPFTMQYIGADTLSSLDDLQGAISTRQSYNQEGGLGIDITTMSPPLQIFAYLFLPLFEVPGILGTLASIENLALLLFFLFFLGPNLATLLKTTKFEVRAHVLFACVATIVLATTTANLGISLRQKYMIFPSFFALGLIAEVNRKKPKRKAKAISVEAKGLEV